MQEQIGDIGRFAFSTNIVEVGGILVDQIRGTQDAIGDAGADLRSAIEDSGRVAARGAVGFSDQIIRALDDAFAEVNAAVAAQAQEFRAAQIAAVGRGRGREAGLEEVFNQIVAGGGTEQQQIANLRRRAANQARIIRDACTGCRKGAARGRRTAQQKLAGINERRRAIEASIAADQKAAAKEQDRIREDAAREQDRLFLQAQEDARTRQERRIILAEDTPAL